MFGCTEEDEVNFDLREETIDEAAAPPPAAEDTRTFFSIRTFIFRCFVALPPSRRLGNTQHLSVCLPVSNFALKLLIGSS